MYRKFFLSLTLVLLVAVVLAVPALAGTVSISNKTIPAYNGGSLYSSSTTNTVTATKYRIALSGLDPNPPSGAAYLAAACTSSGTSGLNGPMSIYNSASSATISYPSGYGGAGQAYRAKFWAGPGAISSTKISASFNSQYQ